MIGKLFSDLIDGAGSVAKQTVKLPARVIYAIDEHQWELHEDGYKCELGGARN